MAGRRVERCCCAFSVLLLSNGISYRLHGGCAKKLICHCPALQSSRDAIVRWNLRPFLLLAYYNQKCTKKPCLHICVCVCVCTYMHAHTHTSSLLCSMDRFFDYRSARFLFSLKGLPKGRNSFNCPYKSNQKTCTSTFEETVPEHFVCGSCPLQVGGKWQQPQPQEKNALNQLPSHLLCLNLLPSHHITQPHDQPSLFYLCFRSYIFVNNNWQKREAGSFWWCLLGCETNSLYWSLSGQIYCCF